MQCFDRRWAEWISRALVRALLGVVAWSLTVQGAAGCKGGRRHERPSKGGEARSARKSWDWPRPRVAWRTPHDGYLYPVAVAGDHLVAAVSSRQRTPRRLVGLELATGRVAWETKRLLAPELVRRAAPWGMCWAVARSGRHWLFAYQRPGGKVTALDASNGQRLWTADSEHGAAALPDGVAVSDGSTLRVLEARSGRVLLSLDLSLPALGAGERKVATGLKRKTCLQAVGDLVVVTRRDGGEIQAISPSSGKMVWRHWEEGELGRHVLRLPTAGDELLVPTAYADPEHLTILWKLPDSGPEARPVWHATLPARSYRKWIWVVGDAIVVLGQDEARRWYVLRLDRNSGRRLSKVQVPSFRDCVLVERRLACRSAGRVFAVDPATGRVRWDLTVGDSRDRLRTVHGAGAYVLAETSRRVYALDVRQGKVAWKWEKKLGDVRVSLWDVPGATGGLTFFLVRTRQEEERLDRLYLVAIRDGNVVWQRRLGRVPPRRRARRVREGDVDLKVAVLLTTTPQGKPVVFTAVDKTLALLDPATGKPTRGFTLPGDPKRPTVLLARQGDSLLLERGGLVLAASASQGKLLWRGLVRSADLTFFGGHEAFFVEADGKVRWLGERRRGAGLSKQVWKAIAGGTVAYADEHRIFVRKDRKVVVLDRASGRVLRKFRPRTYFYRVDGLLFGLERRIRPAEKLGAYIALEARSGRRLWRTVVHAKGEAELPAPVVVERRWPVAWVRAAGPVFVTTDAVGQCVVAISARDGKAAWTLCFDRILGEPAYGNGYLLLSAKGRPHAPDQPATGVRAGGQKVPEGLYAIRVSDGRAKLVYTPGEDRRVRVGSAGPTESGLFVVVEAPIRASQRHRHNEFVALQLWPEP